jgi:hypothetical protein
MKMDKAAISTKRLAESLNKSSQSQQFTESQTKFFRASLEIT